jgi:hypothetical protein
MEKGADAMRMQLRLLTPTMVGILGIFALHTAAFAGSDTGSDVRGSLGASLTDLAVDDGGGTWFFLLNAAFALAFLIAARMLARRQVTRSRSPRSAYRDVDQMTQPFS